MDGISENSQFSFVIFLIDLVDRLLASPLLVTSVSLILLFYLVFRSWLDYVLVCGFALWLANFQVFGHLTANSVLWTRKGDTFAFFLATSSALFCLRLFMPMFLSQSFIWSGQSRPYLIQSRTSHTRLFPKRHSFSYSYLLVGIPVGSKGSINGFISVDEPRSFFSRLFGKSWFTVNAADYMDRGFPGLSLRDKLDKFLVSEDIAPANYPHAYLVTAPRFLGYHFNPVSFWYLYSSNKVLSAIIAEVSNTFGEKRPYLVHRDTSPRYIEETSDSLPTEKAPATPFKRTFPKDFHVSPFNSRKGSYALTSSDPLGPGMNGFRGLDITVNLVSSKGRPKLVARLFSSGETLDPQTISSFQGLWFILRWFWVGFFTMPRIIKEAAVLYFKHQLHVWIRPEPLKDTHGRLADSIESNLEAVFRLYLRHLVESCPEAIVLKYIPSGFASRGEEILESKVAMNGAKEAERVELRVLTPAFYSRFVHYAHDFEAIFSELRESSTIWVDRPEVLPQVFFKKSSPPLQTSNVLDFVSFKAILALRRRPAKIERPMTSAHSTSPSLTSTVDIREFRMSYMDAFVLQHDNMRMKATYRSLLVQLFLADRFFMGMVETPKVVMFLAHVAAAWSITSLWVATLDDYLTS